MSKKHSIDELFRKTLRGHELPAPGKLWNRVESRMEARRERKPVWYLSAAAAVVVLMAAGSYIYYMQTAAPQQMPVVADPATEEALPQLRETKPGPASDAPAAQEQFALDKPATVKKEPEAADIIYARPGFTVSDALAFAQTADELEQELDGLPLEVLDASLIPAYHGKVHMKIADPSRYLAEAMKEQQPVKEELLAYREQINRYAADQWTNLRSGKPLESPPAVPLDWPEVRISFAGLFR